MDVARWLRSDFGESDLEVIIVNYNSLVLPGAHLKGSYCGFPYEKNNQASISKQKHIQ